MEYVNILTLGPLPAPVKVCPTCRQPFLSFVQPADNLFYHEKQSATSFDVESTISTMNAPSKNTELVSALSSGPAR